MSMKFSKFKIPNLNLIEQIKNESGQDHKLNYSFEDEIDLLNMDMPNPANQLTFLDQINLNPPGRPSQTKLASIREQEAQPNRFNRTKSLNVFEFNFNNKKNILRGERQSN